MQTDAVGHAGASRHWGEAATIRPVAVDLETPAAELVAGQGGDRQRTPFQPISRPARRRSTTTRPPGTDPLPGSQTTALINLQ